MTDPRAQRTVLIVEDESDVSEVLAFALRRDGYRVLVASESAEGMAIATAERPDAILLDVMMPGISGWEMLDRLKAHDGTRTIPVIMCTVLAEPRFLERAAAGNAAGFVRKPFKPEEVVRTIRAVLERGAKYGGAPPYEGGSEGGDVARPEG